MSKLTKVDEYLLEKPSRLKNGATRIADILDIDRDEVYASFKKVKRMLKAKEVTPITFQEALEVPNEPIISERMNDIETGSGTATIQSPRPLSPKEIEELVQVDNITTFVSQTWLKSHKNDKWTYSIRTSSLINNFYSTEELDQKIKSLFLDTEPLELPVLYNQEDNNKVLFVYVADDHAGLVLKDSIFNKEYSGLTYAKRLLRLVEEAILLNQTFSQVCIIRLGDELDGYNQKTTRYDHTLGSLSNKEQFDIYTTANKIFYETLFQSGLSEQYTVWNVNNSNHSGLGLSYIANKALEYWLEAKYPTVEFRHQQQFIDVLTLGNHVIGFCHGKDEKYMKRPMPINLDQTTDLYLMDYFKQHTSADSIVHLIKGDMHKYGINQGKFGRYVNVPSISSGSNWIETNYGSSKAGCLLEIFQPDSEAVISIPIWFK